VDPAERSGTGRLLGRLNLHRRADSASATAAVKPTPRVFAPLIPSRRVSMRRNSRVSVGKVMSVADISLQKQQKQRKRLPKAVCGSVTGVEHPRAGRKRCTSTSVRKLADVRKESIYRSVTRDTPSPRLRGEGRGEGVSLRPRGNPQRSKKLAPHPESALRAASDLSPQAGRGDRSSILSPARKQRRSHTLTFAMRY
jgi:hypothetical protein